MLQRLDVSQTVAGFALFGGLDQRGRINFYARLCETSRLCVKNRNIRKRIKDAVIATLAKQYDYWRFKNFHHNTIESNGTMTDQIKVKSLDHVTIVVADLERSRRFYVDGLGMDQVDRPGFSFEGRWFQAGDTQIHLILEHEQSGPAGRNVDQGRSSRAHHFAFAVEDAHAAERQLEALGCDFVSRAKSRPDGATQVFVFDPDGHIVELCSPPLSA